MPLYEYRCRSCKQVFERIVPAGAADEQACPECGGHEVWRLLSLFATAGAAKVSEGGGGSCCSRGGCHCH